ncbi:hypothetical protein NQ317_001690 [Molorchus minor]|uniref:Ribosomal protein L16 n=1 Tax=Molorchus minor TaxID=1323400 RepID=A0ABQ9J8X2_9CUCU|nr:hypothetical protein NQ317_001690 [Molorchus minor]
MVEKPSITMAKRHRLRATRETICLKLQSSGIKVNPRSGGLRIARIDALISRGRAGKGFGYISHLRGGLYFAKQKDAFVETKIRIQFVLYVALHSVKEHNMSHLQYAFLELIKLGGVLIRE